MRSIPTGFFPRSLRLGVGVLMGAILLLAVLSMLISGFIARKTEGLAAAVNQSGSLRMQSYRIGMALADTALTPTQRGAWVSTLAEELEQRLTNPRLVDAIPLHHADSIRAGYDQIVRDWHERMHTALRADLERLRDPSNPLAREHLGLDYLGQVDGFVAHIDTLVGQLEAVTEGRIAMLRLVQTVALTLILTAVLITLVLVQRRVIEPLGALLECADHTRRGDFSIRTRFTGEDELGRVGAAINRMAEDLSGLYADLEERVLIKTRDLERTNHCLELLYEVGQTLHESPLSQPMLHAVLLKIRDRLGLRAVTLCLQNDPDARAGRERVTTRSDLEQRGACSTTGCLACRDAATAEPFLLPIRQGGARAILSFPVADQSQRFGVLIVDLDGGRTLAPWQSPLLTSLAALLGTALSRHRRLGDARRLSLYEERAIIARELHDSLAQSLSYLKIQAARLDALLDPTTVVSTRPVLAELRAGISNAYRQLRELLVTFRLKMDARGLAAALDATVAEFRGRGNTQIRLANRLPRLLLSPHEEIHVLQIVREALSNVSRHAQASHATLRLTASRRGIRVTIEDDGRGLDPALTHPGHHGLTIMRERAASLGGTLRISNRPRGGTRVCLTFPRHDEAPEDDFADRLTARMT
ncbi:MAG: HAMP domain-containing protein [Sphingobacteriia bacterium]|nr:HAMP domain-containing protein [Sphingobacteriia bacterium]NCC40978.1 HAMP domain-containing protein [Gammaproteobacteria bacterium]